MCLVDCSFGHKKKCLAIFFDDVTNTSLARVWCVLWFVCTLTFVDRTSHHPHSTSPPEHKRTKKEKKTKLCVCPYLTKPKLGAGNASHVGQSITTIPIPATSSTSSTSSSSATSCNNNNNNNATSPQSPPSALSSVSSSGGSKTLKIEPGSNGGSAGGGSGTVRPSSADEGAIISSHDGRQLASPHQHHQHHHQHHHQQQQHHHQHHLQNNGRDGEF